jgi:hypothetical protein
VCLVRPQTIQAAVQGFVGAQPPRPVALDVYAWIGQRIRGMGRGVDPLRATGVRRAMVAQRACETLRRVMRYFEELWGPGGAQALVMALVDEGTTLEDLRTLPLGVALPLLEALHYCRTRAPQG